MLADSQDLAQRLEGGKGLELEHTLDANKTFPSGMETPILLLALSQDTECDMLLMTTY